VLSYVVTCRRVMTWRLACLAFVVRHGVLVPLIRDIHCGGVFMTIRRGVLYFGGVLNGVLIIMCCRVVAYSVCINACLRHYSISWRVCGGGGGGCFVTVSRRTAFGRLMVFSSVARFNVS